MHFLGNTCRKNDSIVVQDPVCVCVCVIRLTKFEQICQVEQTMCSVCDTMKEEREKIRLIRMYVFQRTHSLVYGAGIKGRTAIDRNN